MEKLYINGFTLEHIKKKKKVAAHYVVSQDGNGKKFYSRERAIGWIIDEVRNLLEKIN